MINRLADKIHNGVSPYMFLRMVKKKISIDVFGKSMCGYSLTTHDLFCHLGHFLTDIVNQVEHQNSTSWQ